MNPTSVVDRRTERSGHPLWPQRERLLVAVDGSRSSQAQLVWALQEAVRRDATVLAVAVLDTDAPADARIATRTALQAQALTAEIESGVPGRSRTLLVDQLRYQTLIAAARDGDIVIVREHRTTALRQAPDRPPVRRPMARCA